MRDDGVRGRRVKDEGIMGEGWRDEGLRGRGVRDGERNPGLGWMDKGSAMMDPCWLPWIRGNQGESRLWVGEPSLQMILDF